MRWFTIEAGQKKVRGELPETIRLSPSTMKLLFDCRACLHKHARGYRRPSFPVAGITHGVDRVAKELCDLHRPSGTIPLMLSAGLEGQLLPEKPKTINWIVEELKCQVVGKLDEIVVESGGKIAPLDHKSCNAPPPTVIPGVQLQLDTYALLLAKSSMYSGGEVSSRGYLLYHFPVLERGVAAAGGRCGDSRMTFASELRQVEVNPDRAYEVIREVLDVVRGPKPPADPDCDYCKWNLI